ncbi:hypothetical protein Tco_1369441 [Tanacetum coccineum]
MLAPRSAKALHVLIPENSHGIRNRPGSPSFFAFHGVFQSLLLEGNGIDVVWLEEIGALNGINIGLGSWILRLDLNNRRLDVFGASVISRKHRVLCNLVPEPEVEAVLEVTNLESMSIKLGQWFLQSRGNIGLTLLGRRVLVLTLEYSCLAFVIDELMDFLIDDLLGHSSRHLSEKLPPTQSGVQLNLDHTKFRAL